MTIAYLKRALRAISTAVEAATQMSQDGSLKSRQFEELCRRPLSSPGQHHCHDGRPSGRMAKALWFVIRRPGILPLNELDGRASKVEAGHSPE